MKRSFFLSIAIFFICFSIVEAALNAEINLDSQTIIFAGDAKYPPYEFLDEDNNPSGFSVEISKALAKVMGMNIEIRLASWDKMRALLDSGEIDLLQGMSYLKEREKEFKFSHPYTLIHYCIFIRKDTAPVYSLKALAGKKVLVQNNDLAHDILKTSYPEIIIVPVAFQEDALRQLSAGAYDYAIVAHLPGIYFIKSYKLTNIKVVGRPVAVEGYCYAVSKNNNTNIIPRINEGLAILKRTGQFDRIYEDWLGVLEPGMSLKKKLRIGSVIGIILIIGILLTLLWTATLKKQVALRTEELNREIKARRKAAKELETNHKRLIQADKMASLGYLVAGIAHELNNPNGLILMNLPLLSDACWDALPILEEWYKKNGDFKLGGLLYSRMKNEMPLLLSETNEASIQIKTIVEDLKDFGRQSDDDYSEPSNINTLVENSLRLVKKTVEKSSNDFSVNYGETLPMIDVNPQRIEQVIINLILNACQALKEPSNALYLSTEYEHDTEKVKFIIKDQGIGIPKENIPHLTDPFFTTKRSEGGTGLGLSISAGIIKANKGSIEFESSVGVGTMVVISFPAVQ